MSFDSTTNTITIKEDGDILADSGALFLKMMKELGSKADAREGFVADWKVVEGWLGCHGRDLTDADYEKFGLVFRSYTARGVAPSVPLEASFKMFAEMARNEKWQLVPVPPELVPVFKRLLASDKEIEKKRANDALRLAAALAPAPAPRQAASSPPDVPVGWIPLAASIVLLLMASADSWPYGFYQLLRIVVTGTASYALVLTAQSRKVWPWVMGAIAILFNPVLPISFTREEWQPIDFGVAIIFSIALIQALRRRL